MSQNSAITAEAIAFVEKVSYNDLPAEALRIGKRCMVDTLGVMIAGCSEHSVHILVEDALEQGGRAAAHSEDPAVGTSATELPHIVKEKVRRERLRSQTESGCDHRAARSAAGHQPNFWRPRGAFVLSGSGRGCLSPMP